MSTRPSPPDADVAPPTTDLSPSDKRALLARLLAERAAAPQGAPASPTASTRAAPASIGPAPALAGGAPARAQHPFHEHVNPHLGRLLRRVGLDKRFVRGRGSTLLDDEGKEYLDFIAMYGALPFGYHPPEIWEALRAVELSGEPSFAQPSLLDAAGELARRLIALAPEGLRYVTFTNSGAESVEAGLKIARAATGRRRILSTLGGFHGKTLGALSATGRRTYQEPFGLPVEGFDHIPYGDVRALDEALVQHGHEIAAFLVEPIQGEGGVVVPPADYLRRARDLCTRHGVLLIVDEIQTGLGRTGRLFACEEAGVSPDVLLLAKALGGGLVPIGAVLFNEAAATEDFALKHSSTFAGGALACRVGLRTLELLTEGDLLARVIENGAHLKGRLTALQQRYPELITAVRGRGFLLGVEWSDRADAFDRRCLLGCMAETEDLAIAVCSYLLNEHRIRVMTTLNGERVLRIEPPLTATRAECDRVVGALEETVAHLRACNSARIFAHLAGPSVATPTPPPAPTPGRGFARPSGDPAEGRWAFITHPTHAGTLAHFDPSFTAFSPAQLQRFQDDVLQESDELSILATMRVASRTGAVAYGEFIHIPYSAEALTRLPLDRTVKTIRKAVALARDRGARIVGLGAFTSIVTRNGLLLRDLGVALTTGNSYTVVATIEGLRSAAQRRGLDLGSAAVAVVGATGSIGRAVASLLLEEVGRLFLISSPDPMGERRERLEQLCREIVAEAGPRLARGRGELARCVAELSARTPDPSELVAALVDQGRLTLGAGVDDRLAEVDGVITATSSPEKFLRSRHLKQGALVYDTSEPSNVDDEVRATRPDVALVDGGVIRLPGGQDVGFSFGLPPGAVYACMAETMMLGLEHRSEHGSLGGHLSEDFLRYVRELAPRHGFTLDR